MSAEAVARTLLATLNRPAGRLFGRLRIGNAALAYIASCFTGTATVAAAALVLSVVQADEGRPWGEFGFRYFLVSGTMAWLVISVIGLVVAAPFVIVATWLGSSHRKETALYYLGLGGLSASAVALMLTGISSDLSDGLALWWILPPCGACFGAAWWYLHRRWKSEEGAADAERLAAVFLDGRAD